MFSGLGGSWDKFRLLGCFSQLSAQTQPDCSFSMLSGLGGPWARFRILGRLLLHHLWVHGAPLEDALLDHGGANLFFFGNLWRIGIRHTLFLNFLQNGRFEKRRRERCKPEKKKKKTFATESGFPSSSCASCPSTFGGDRFTAHS